MTKVRMNRAIEKRFNFDNFLLKSANANNYENVTITLIHQNKRVEKLSLRNTASRQLLIQNASLESLK